MNRIEIPSSVVLVTGEELKLAQVALNDNFIKFVTMSRSIKDEAELINGIRTLLVSDCIKNANRTYTPEEVAANLELIPFNFYMELIASFEKL